MSEPVFDPEYTHIRLEKKAVSDDEWIKAFLKKSPVGVLATALNNQPFLSTKLFVYDENRHVIYMHAADAGRVFTNIQSNPNVCFTTYLMGRLLPSDRASGFTVEYESVVVFGQINVVESRDEVMNAMQQLMEKYAPHLRYGVDYSPVEDDDCKGLAVYRLQIADWSGKRGQGAADHPGAFNYDEGLAGN